MLGMKKSFIFAIGLVFLILKKHRYKTYVDIECVRTKFARHQAIMKYMFLA